MTIGLSLTADYADNTDRKTESFWRGNISDIREICGSASSDIKLANKLSSWTTLSLRHNHFFFDSHNEMKCTCLKVIRL